MKELKWTVIIRDELYNVIFSKDMSEINCAYPRIMNIYELERNGIFYNLATLEDKTYRLYSHKRKALILAGASKRLQWIPSLTEEIH